MVFGGSWETAVCGWVGQQVSGPGKCIFAKKGDKQTGPVGRRDEFHLWVCYSAVSRKPIRLDENNLVIFCQS